MCLVVYTVMPRTHTATATPALSALPATLSNSTTTTALTTTPGSAPPPAPPRIAARKSNATVHLEVTIPGDWQPGKKLGFTHEGRRYEVVVPDGYEIGNRFRIFLNVASEKERGKRGRNKITRQTKNDRSKRKSDAVEALAVPKKRGRPKKIQPKRETAADRKAARARNDDAVVRACFQKFFSGGTRGRTPEHIRRMMDSILTVLASSDEVDGKMLDRYLGTHSGRMVERLNMARKRMEFNRSLEPSQRSKMWKWWDPTAKRKDAYGPEMCADAAAFWRVSTIFLHYANVLIAIANMGVI